MVESVERICDTGEEYGEWPSEKEHVVAKRLRTPSGERRQGVNATLSFLGAYSPSGLDTNGSGLVFLRGALGGVFSQ